MDFLHLFQVSYGVPEMVKALVITDHEEIRCGERTAHKPLSYYLQNMK